MFAAGTSENDSAYSENVLLIHFGLGCVTWDSHVHLKESVWVKYPQVGYMHQNTRYLSNSFVVCLREQWRFGFSNEFYPP